MKYLLAAILLFSSSTICFSQNQAVTIDVSLNVSADAVFKNSLKSLITRELMELDDVRIVTQNYAYHSITIVALEDRGDDYTRGYYSSVLVTKVVDTEPLIKSLASLETIRAKDAEEREIIQKDYSDSKGEMIRSYIDGSVKIIFNILLADHDLENLAKRIVAEIDIEVLEDTRKYYLPYLRNRAYLQHFNDH